jgi:2-C-methyl-D-erythritol 4-phosphate cytidylyltransferase
MLFHALRPFLDDPRVVSVVVALSAQQAEDPPAWLAQLAPRVRTVRGGDTRTASVLAALESLGPEVEIVLVHDAARPLVTRSIVDRCVTGVLAGGGGAVTGSPVVDTLKEVDPDGRVLGTVDRSRFWRAQTPQGFPLDALLEAYRRAVDQGRGETDDAAVFERCGGIVHMVEGSPVNLKVTYPEELEFAEWLLSRPESDRENGRG